MGIGLRAVVAVVPAATRRSNPHLCSKHADVCAADLDCVPRAQTVASYLWRLEVFGITYGALLL